MPGTVPNIPGLDQSAQNATQAPMTDAFGQAPPAGGESGLTALPNLIGDQNSFLNTFGSATPTSVTNTPKKFNRGIAAALAQVGRGAFKITENESPAPQDRFFITSNIFYNVGKAFNPTGPNVEGTNVYREVVGFEKTFLSGDASFGMRLPFLQAQGEFIDKNDFGDLTMIFKYAFINDRDTGNLVSGGLVLTVPTGADFLPDSTIPIHSTLLQPYFGTIWRRGDFFVHGFTSVLVPTDDRDVLFLFNDYGLGYFVYRNPSTFITGIAPTVEFHVNTPLNHRGSQVDPLGGIDVFDMTYGATICIGRNADLTLGVNTPLTGPRPYDIEAVAQLNWRF
jgi:hypothetical protein